MPNKRIAFLIMGVALLIVGVALMTLSIVQKPQEIQIPVNTSSPSYLMLSNWSNMSIYISTGYPIPKPILNGESSKPPGIVQVFYSNYGPLGINVTITNAGNTKAAYLALNNTVIIEEDYGETSIFTPPNYTSIVVIQRSTINTMIFINVFIPSTYSYEVVNRTYILITKPIPIGIYSGTNITIRSTSKGVILSTGGNYTYIILNLDSNEIMPISELININNHEVNNWLSLARKPRLNGVFLDEYYLSLLLIIDDQNPVTGEFVASPEPVYLYSWVRDSSFAAMALQSAGYYEQAMKYWLWMCNAQNVSGTWYTRYDFWSGAPDKTFGIPEYDSVGLFQIGIWQFYELTHNKTFLMEVMPCINKSLIWEENEIQNNGGLIPMDLSIWESNYAYNFWTQAIDDLGLYATAKIYRALGLNNTPIIKLANELNATIQKYFYSRNFYSQALMETTIYTSNGSETTYAPNGIPDSSVILPIAMGLINPRSRQAISTVNTIIRTLLINGGLARFPGDDYHYDSGLYDSTAPDPPWIITTLFLAMYYEDVGNSSGALDLMAWCIQHSQHGLLPEAVDPRLGYPLPTTSPLTWSAAMYVLASLNYKPQQRPVFAIMVMTSIIVILLSIVMFTVYGKKR
ncbi:MAG: glycoside hydrolase family 15 protein [Vulcanisaeta sp.]